MPSISRIWIAVRNSSGSCSIVAFTVAAISFDNSTLSGVLMSRSCSPSSNPSASSASTSVELGAAQGVALPRQLLGRHARNLSPQRPQSQGTERFRGKHVAGDQNGAPRSAEGKRYDESCHIAPLGGLRDDPCSVCKAQHDP